MNCPLCHNSKIKETLFVARNAFISSSKLDNLAQRKNLTGSGGGQP
ncbi:sugar transferase [Campylobacter coli]|nr:sugar transferase [Campylobacter jejuni]